MGKVRILDINEFHGQDELTDFYCNDFRDHLNTHHKNITIPHKHNFFLTVIFTKGTGVHEIDFEKYVVRPGSVFMLNPGQTHYWQLSNDIEGIIFFHSQEFFEVSFTNQSVFDFPFFYSVHNSSALSLNDQERTSFVDAFEMVFKEYRAKDAFSKPKIVSLLHCIYIDLTRVYLKSSKVGVVKPSGSSEYLRTLEQLIEDSFRSEKSPAVYADKLNITIRHLNRLTQEALGKSTTQLITERVILEAKRMIIYDPTSLAKISYELGYEDYAYFSRIFKKWSGFTPSGFSKLYRSI